jgi:hypothetical protein
MMEIKAHSASVVKLRISYDEQFLFSCGVDGSVFIFQLSDRDEKKQAMREKFLYTDEVCSKSLLMVDFGH